MRTSEIGHPIAGLFRAANHGDVEIEKKVAHEKKVFLLVSWFSNFYPTWANRSRKERRRGILDIFLRPRPWLRIVTAIPFPVLLPVPFAFFFFFSRSLFIFPLHLFPTANHGGLVTLLYFYFSLLLLLFVEPTTTSF